MEFMGISVGILALICTAMLLFGRRGTVKILASLVVLTVLGMGGTVGFFIWQEQHKAAPLIKVQSADGIIHEFPAGTSTDVIDRVMKDYAASHAKPAAGKAAQAAPSPPTLPLGVTTGPSKAVAASRPCSVSARPRSGSAITRMRSLLIFNGRASGPASVRPFSKRCCAQDTAGSAHQG